MINTLVTNPFIERVINEVDSILENKCVDYYIKRYLYVVVLGLFMKYGEQYEERIFDLIKRVKIETNYNKITNIAKENNLNELFNDDKNKIWSFKYNNEYTICIKDNINFKGILFLEMLIKEFNLLFNSLDNDEDYIEGCNIKRNGLCQKYILNNEVIKIEGNVINNIFNVLEAEEIIKYILNLKYRIIDNELVKEVLSELKVIDIDNYTFGESNVLVNIFRKLYSIDEFRIMITNVLISGDIDELKESFDEILGYDSYKVLDYNLTEAYINYNECKISNLKVYDYTVRHCILRSMINKYINEKYCYVNE